MITGESDVVAHCMDTALEEQEELRAVQGVQEMIERAAAAGNKMVAVPAAFVRPPDDRTGPLSVSSDHEDQMTVPIIDISGLHSPQLRPLVLDSIAQACADWSFFQVVNHGVKDEVIQEMRTACWRFFNQPASERNKLWSQNSELPVSYTTSFNPSKESTLNWKDVLYVRDMPGVCSNGFNSAPEICRDAFQQYRMAVEQLAKSLFDAIFDGLGLSLATKKERLPPPARLVMAVNFYPPCPDPGVTYGISPHSDIGYITVLLQDEVPGLHIKRGEKWCLVKPVPNAFVINLADQIEILSNGLYKSIEHLAITNVDRPRMSVACFFGPKDTDTIGPLPDFVDESKPAKYKAVRYGDYVGNFASKALLPNRGTLNLVK